MGSLPNKGRGSTGLHSPMQWLLSPTVWGGDLTMHPRREPAAAPAASPPYNDKLPTLVEIETPLQMCTISNALSQMMGEAH